ncbi:MAG: L-asparaginase [Candidatus Rifleibacterium amylolyticum]|nr:MAG: L-asparaginase [Candidatus Rifleibacterium amylolyticum]
MNKSLLTRCFFVLYLLTITCLATAAELPEISILATGGTIAGSGASATGSAYKAAVNPVDKVISAVPQLEQIARIRGEQICNISSQDMKPEYWLKLAARINQLFRLNLADGVVITHGTDTLEETAWFLNLTVAYDKPVVLTGSMRPGSALSADGAMNLYNAVAVAGAREARNKGVLVVMNDRIYSARGVRKCDTINPAAFDDRENGALGRVNYGKVSFNTRPDKKHTYQSLVKLPLFAGKLPEVPIIYGYAGIDPQMVETICQSNIRGIVYAGVGNGNPSEEVLNVLAKASAVGITVVRATRVPDGPVTLDAEVDDAKYGFIVSDSLTPQKARILLMLALHKDLDRSEIQRLYFEY